MLGSIQEHFVLSNQAIKRDTGWKEKIKSGPNALQPILCVHVLSLDLFSQFICLKLKLQTQNNSEKTNCPNDQYAKFYMIPIFKVMQTTPSFVYLTFYCSVTETSNIASKMQDYFSE